MTSVWLYGFAQMVAEYAPEKVPDYAVASHDALTITGVADLAVPPAPETADESDNGLKSVFLFYRPRGTPD